MNPNLNKKKIISWRKFSRMFSQNLHKAGYARKWMGHDIGYVSSVQAFEKDDFVYVRFPCKRNISSRIDTFCVRYDLINPMDDISFEPYPTKVFAPIEF